MNSNTYQNLVLELVFSVGIDVPAGTPATEADLKRAIEKAKATSAELVAARSAWAEDVLKTHELRGDVRELWRVALIKDGEKALLLLKATVDTKRDEAVREYQTNNSCDFQTAWNRAGCHAPGYYLAAR